MSKANQHDAGVQKSYWLSRISITVTATYLFGPLSTYGLTYLGLSKVGPIAGGFFAKTQSTMALAGWSISKGSFMAFLQTWSMTSTPPAVVYLVLAYATYLATQDP